MSPISPFLRRKADIVGALRLPSLEPPRTPGALDAGHGRPVLSGASAGQFAKMTQLRMQTARSFGT
jgi:hypothetical protein